VKTFRPKPVQLAGLKLTPEEGFVLSRIDGRLSTQDLVALTGMEERRVEEIVSTLEKVGAVELEAAEASGVLPDDGSDRELDRHGSREVETSLADFAAVLGMDPTAFVASGAPAARETPLAPGRALTSESMRVAAPAAPASPVAAPEMLDELIEAEAVGSEESAGSEADERTYRALYEQKWRKQTTDERTSAAKGASGMDLLALCFDAEPRVAAAVLENPAHGLEHARLLAAHHHTSTGLEILTRRQDLLRDVMIERRLLKNPQAGDLVLGRVMNPKRLLPTYKVAIDREVPELTRVKARGMLRQKFQTSPPEERADFILRTEGRSLILMTGCTFDAKTTQILCGRPYNSVLFIQNLVKWPATPPALLAHLAKQPFVRKSAPLKKLLLQHPNLPGEVKRQI
jgi:hypothetical protein